MRGVAYEPGKYGVPANCVCPGPVDTAWTRKETGPMDAAIEQQTVAGTVLGRWHSRGMINVFAFGASDEAIFMTGSLVFADGHHHRQRRPGQHVQDLVREQPQLSLDPRHSQRWREDQPVQNRAHQRASEPRFPHSSGGASVFVREVRSHPMKIACRSSPEKQNIFVKPM